MTTTRRSIRLFVSMAFAFSFMAPSHALAITRVYYDPTNAPLMGPMQSPLNTFTMERFITTVLRHFEAHSFGRVQFDYLGTTTNAGCGSLSPRIAIRWVPGMTACASMITAGTCELGNLNLNPAIIAGLPGGDATPPTTLISACGDIRNSLTHELSHWFRWDITEPFDHPDDSVLHGSTATITNLVGRHLWLNDMQSFHGFFNPSRPVHLSLDIYNNASGAVTDLGGSTHIGMNFTGSLAPGTNGNMYARAFSVSLSTPVQVQQGNGVGSSWSAPQHVWFDPTLRRTCMATRPSSGKMFVLWTDWPQASATPAAGNGRFSGTHKILCAMSSNGGTVWNLCSPAAGMHTLGANFASARTRSGLGCSYDAVADRVALAFSDQEERLTVASLPATTTGQSDWSAPATMTDGNGNPIWSSDEAEVSFDPFSNDNMGIVTWFDGNELNQRSMWIRYSTSANRYIANSSINSPFITNAHVFGAEANLLRSSVVANTISATAHFAFVRQTAGWQQRYRYLPSSSSTDHINNWGPPVRLDIYTGSAANTVLIETAYLRQGFLY